MATIAPQISAAGIVSPDFEDIRAEHRAGYFSIYGSDAVLGNDTQDGQLIALLSQVLYDVEQALVAVFNSFSPTSAQGAALSSLVKINGLLRHAASRSSAVVTVVGVVGTQIQNGSVGNSSPDNLVWTLPALVVIPDAGQIDVTATCSTEGAMNAPAGSLTRILTPTLGWQSVTNVAAATVGAPVETDADLRLRQSQSTSLPALSVTESIYAAVANLAGVKRVAIYENSGDAVDVNGIPAHTIAPVVDGGDAAAIVETIALKKTPGTGTAGSVSTTILDSKGVPVTIRYYPLVGVPMHVQITILALPGYVAPTGAKIRQAVCDFVNAFDIGEDSYVARLFSPANFGGIGIGATFVVLGISQARGANPLTAANVAIAFNEAATCLLSDVTLVVT